MLICGFVLKSMAPVKVLNNLRSNGGMHHTKVLLEKIPRGLIESDCKELFSQSLTMSGVSDLIWDPLFFSKK
jgi:hypothetical protein